MHDKEKGAAFRIRKGLLLAVCGCVLAVGCQKPAIEFAEKAAQPVTVMTLVKAAPPSSFMASGSVKSWKTEDLGFEVSGRLEWVLEPGLDVDGRIVDPDGKLIHPGTPLAQIETAQYDIAVESAEADVEVAERKKESIKIRLDEALPVEIESAEADLKLAKIEFQRMQTLNAQQAASQSEFDQAENLVHTRQAALRSLEASEKQARADLKSAESEVRRAQQVLREAQRDLKNTTLYGSYQGQIAEVMVVPGSVVTAGSPVLKLQMSNPIKVEVELSSQQSRQIRQRRNLPASFPLPDGTTRHVNAFVYSIAPSADPTTRTFTMTLLLLNEKFRDNLPESISEDTVARSQDIWPLKLNRMMGTPPEVTLVEEKSIHHDDEGAFVYRVTNATLDGILPKILKVQRQRLIEHDLRIPFLGNWIFRSVSFLDDQGDSIKLPQETIYVGELADGPSAASAWDGESVVLDAGAQWMLRPGDLVSVDLSSNDAELGFHVPIEAIYEESDETYLFAAQDGHAKKLAVQLKQAGNLNAGSLVEVQSPALTDGMQVIVQGVHYLHDGEAVRIVQTALSETPKTVVPMHVSEANVDESESF
ncbi:membrane-fusion protein [Rhodopirellula maiorica SM1]|uniref:Membrane-fusion protein n=1 Tax=Rhodopirellula maiorica SM1 TaxID=1265738 RepID=M5RMI1_9BACT|nr:HlyD family efflux transporter periplasmic adaptor subunit [Rhodopirellula maiorica]EMI20396.1 membrane-fusion protein [Rhodopirellula maiorica SM1]